MAILSGRWFRWRPGNLLPSRALVPVERQGFDLRLWFAIGSFGTIAIICLFSAFWVSSFLTTSLLERESEVSQEFLESIVSIDGSAIFHDFGDDPAARNPILLDFARHITSMPGIFRVNIYAPSHRVLWSTEPTIVGKIFEINPELAQAFLGRRVTEIETLTNDTKPEHIALGEAGYFIEAYIPIRADNGRGPVVGVVEFYKLPLALETKIRNARWAVWLSAAAAALVLFLALYWIVQRGAQVIERQQTNLARMEAFAAIGQMSSAVAHSLRNPMSAIRSSAELWRSELPAGERETADEVIREVDRMDGYVGDLLAFAQSEPYHLHHVDPASVIETILAKHQRAIGRNAISVETHLGGAPTPKVLADERLLEQAITSIVTNAVEAMPEGGKLVLSILAGRRADELRIEVRDSGKGIPAELMERVAVSYFTTKARGLGLGLVLAKGIIERFQGRLEIDSTPQVGTTANIDLKLA